MSHQRRNRLFWLGSMQVVMAAVLYCSWPLGLWLNPAASASGLASELGAVGQPYNWLFIGGDVASGIILVIGCGILLRVLHANGWLRLCIGLLAVYGIAGAIDASLPLACVPSLQVCGPVFRDPVLILHGVVDITGSAALLGTLYAGYRYAKQSSTQWLPWVYAIGIGGTLFAIASGVLYVMNGPGYWAQRYYITLSCIWVASIPFVFRSRAVVSSRKPIH